MPDISIHKAASHFNYCPVEGGIRWKTSSRNGSRKAGALAGTTTVRGYRAVGVGRSKFLVHRIVWILHHGDIPDGLCIDHIDGCGLNNKIENLRLTTIAGNQRNSRVPNTNRTGVMNVSWHKRAGKFVVTVCGRHFGLFTSMGDAIKARNRARQELGCHPNHGRRTA